MSKYTHYFCDVKPFLEIKDKKINTGERRHRAGPVERIAD